jgi:hypothetical protein
MDFDNLNAIYKKTDKGIEALKTRDASLPQKLRVLLIPIDGKKTLSELTPLLTIGSDSHLRIKELFDAGFITEAIQHPAPSQALQNALNQNSAVETTDKTTDSAKNLQTAIRSATKMLSDMLGPNSDVLCMQLEKCKTKDEYNAKVLEFRKIVGAMRTQKHGDDFVKSAIF